MFQTAKSVLKPVSIFSAGCVAGAGGATILRCRERQQLSKQGEFYENSGQFYQVLGRAWDHFRRDFCIVYRPLYHSEAQEGRWEAHVLATSHLEGFKTFRRVDFTDLDLGSKSYVLPGPFWQDEKWVLPLELAPVPDSEQTLTFQDNFLTGLQQWRTCTTSGYGTHTHQEIPTKHKL